jgi:SAM-dependent methyltransferase
LAVHYFDEAMTRRVFAEISRVLAPGGDFYVLLNSVRDPELGSGRQLEPRYEEREPGNRKRYFTTDELADLAAPGLRVLSARYGTGTTKNPHDEWVRLHATRPQETT